MPTAALPHPTDPARNAAPVEPAATPSDARHLLSHGGQVVAANLLIAGLIATLSGGRLGHVLVYSQCIGLSIWLIIEFGVRLDPRRGARWPAGWRGPALVAIACALGYVIGITVADAIFGDSSWRAYLRDPAQLLRDFGPTVVFCTIVAAGFWSRGQARAHREQMAASAHEATLARLNLLQSQLEPHMLFNTLANLRTLIDADPRRAQEMLDHLIAFLRATLDASRVVEHALADEFSLVTDYLALMQVRMGDRLRVSTDLPTALETVFVPPLLLQPLVENAIKHGLEPQRGAGELRVSAAVDGPTLVLTVIDSGRGLEASAAARARETDESDAGRGFGTRQVRERLQMHDGHATFTLASRAEGGTRAEIRLPLDPLHPAWTPPR